MDEATPPMTAIQQRCLDLIALHGSQRSAAKACGIHETHFHHLRTGNRQDPTDETLARIGLKRIVEYVALEPGHHSFGLKGKRALVRETRARLGP